MSNDRTRVLTASENPTVHTTIARALALLGEEDAATLQLVRADTAAETLAVAAAEQPSIAFLDVTIGAGAGIGLVHFLPATVPGLVVVAIVPEGADHDVRLVEQAASLGASWVLLGELTGDDVLRAFSRVAPSFHRSVPPPDAGSVPPPSENTVARNAKVADARSFADLDAILTNIASDLPAGDAAVALCVEVKAAVHRCLTHERTQRSTMQDATTSAYSFAYFVDLAGREIDLARRHGRRFALATIELDPATIDARATIELVLGAVRDTDIVARAEENELLLLLPETGAKGARILRRRVLDRVHQHARASSRESGRIASVVLPVRVGIASFPFDGEDLSRLLRIARRRAARWAPYDASSSIQALLVHAVEWLSDPKRGAPHGVGPLHPIDAPLRDAWGLLDTLVRESTRAGDAVIAIHAPPGAGESALGLAQGIRASTLDAIGPSSGAGVPSRSVERDVLSMITGVSRLAEGAKFQGFEMVSILAEHACYGLIGRVDDGRLLALHGHDLPVVEALVQGLEQPVLRRGSVGGSSNSASSAAPSAARSSRSDASGLRRS